VRSGSPHGIHPYHAIKRADSSDRLERGQGQWFCRECAGKRGRRSWRRWTASWSGGRP